MTDYQPSLFSASELRGSYKVTPVTPQITVDALNQWKQRILDYQQQVRQQQLQQGSLFQSSLFEAAAPLIDPSNDHADHYCEPVSPDAIDPFRLPPQNTEFWRWQADDAGVAALYFVIDYERSILLYVGETVKSNQRWKGEHDCKRYLLNYRQAHYQLQLSSRLGIAFWAQAPAETRPRQRLELALIKKWRSPFNKENWQFWGTPFVY
ncbi:MAG: GIY-YIG nuclease family protein [Elainella sp. Prado103]|nr:GIY-YIG nuclease family protein [Elainella sp. Prado103]